MPTINDPTLVRDLLARCFGDGEFSAAEAQEALTAIARDGATPAEVEAVVAAFAEALAVGPQGARLDVSTPARRAQANAFLAQLHALCPLPLEAEPGTQDLIGVLALQANQTPIASDLPRPGYAGQRLGLERSGGLVLDGQRVRLDAAAPSAEQLAALQGLLRPGQLDGLPAQTAQRLASRLAAYVAGAGTISADTPDKLLLLGSLAAACGALRGLAAHWTPETADAALAAYPQAATPLMQSLLLDGLAMAPLTSAQANRRDGLTVPADAPLLRATFDELADERAQAGYRTLEGQAAAHTLAALTSAKTAEGAGNLLTSVGAFTALCPQGWDEATSAALGAALADYIQSKGQVVYLFGTFAADAPKLVGAIKSERLAATLRPGLQAEPPSLAGYPLTREQADYLLTVVHGLRDEDAVSQLARCLDLAAHALGGPYPQPWGGQQANAPLCPAAFGLFQRACDEYQRLLGSGHDGRLGYDDLAARLELQAREMAALVAPRQSSLTASAPAWVGTPVSAEAAAYLQGLLAQHLRSPMSIGNLDRAVAIVAGHHGGRIDGAGLQQLTSIVDSYMAEWPGLRFYDFNKLERIATCAVEGKPFPAFTIDGQRVGLAQFYGAVGTRVAAAFDRAALKHSWMADRYGHRARVAAELVDVIAEQAARGEGPLALLRRDYPGKELRVEFTGRDGGHEQFVYCVRDGARNLARFTQGSDGALKLYNQNYGQPVFTAMVGGDGELHLDVGAPLRLTRYPLQEDYGVGDSIDVEHLDRGAPERSTAGQPFSTRYKILEGRITAFSADGRYTVEYTDPAGQRQTKVFELGEIRRANNPHYFKPGGASFSDVKIDVDEDRPLADFIAGARPIIARHLPTDGSLAALAPAELAERQKACIADLQAYAAEHMVYPTELQSNPDADSRRYHELIDGAGSWSRVPLGKLLEIKRGVCRHQCIVQHLLLQEAGIDSRLASGAANTSSNGFRGFHIWVEVTLADGERYLSDQTWSDVAIPLWAGAYDVDARRKEMYDRTARYSEEIVLG